jgi:hypothetical protein
MAAHALTTPDSSPKRRGRASVTLDARTRARLEAAAEQLIAALDTLEGEPDAEPDEDGEVEPAEASAQALTLVRNVAPATFVRQPPRFAHANLSEVRLVPIEGRAMEPTLRRGDVAWAVPARRYSFEGLYVLDMRGTLDVVRAQAIGPDAIRISRDDPAYIPHVFTRAEFEGAVVGHVAAIGRIVVPTLLEGRMAV